MCATSRVRHRSIGRVRSEGPDHRSESGVISGFCPPAPDPSAPGACPGPHGHSDVISKVLFIFILENQQFRLDMERTWIHYVRVTDILAMFRARRL